jgi:hypothetical protein
MTQHERIHREKTEAQEKGSSNKKKAHQPLYDQLKAQDEGVIDFGREASTDGHAALLAEAHSDQQRASLVLGLQQAYGNAYVQRLLNSKIIQAKLTVNPPDDEYEREADRVANAVTEIQRQPVEEEEEELMMKPSQIQRQEEEEEEEIQTKAVGSQPLMVSENLEAQIHEASEGGQSLTSTVRNSLEPYLGRDFGQVRIHTDAEADKLSRQLGAEAFTTGHDVFFRKGAYQPHTESGKELIAHELTHVVQQKAAEPVLQRDEVEQEATATTVTSETLTGAQRNLWNRLVTTPVDEAYTEALRETPDWQTLATTLSDVSRAIEDFTGAVSITPEMQESISSFRSLVFDCYLMAHSHATGGAIFGSNLVRARDWARRLAGESE